MNTFHRTLVRQIKKHIPNFDSTCPNLQAFLDSVNQTYSNFERDKELFEQASKLNDNEFRGITEQLKLQLKEKNDFQIKLQQLILSLDENYSSANENVEINQLINILKLQIENKNKFQKELVEAKNLAEKANSAKTDFLSMMSHEIRTPLNAIIGLLYIMEKENTHESFIENLDILKFSANTLHVLINDILDFNKIEEGKVDLEKIPFNIKFLISEIKKSLETKAQEKENKIKLFIDEDIVEELVGDPFRIGQIITNLVSNAIKFTLNGVIIITLDLISKDKDFSTIKVSIKDTGIGIPKDKFELIFEKFTQADNQITRKFGGSGLGLVITSKLLRLMDSVIELQSEVNVGSTFAFKLTLPIAKDFISEKTQKKEHLLQIEEDLNGMKILLVEDYDINVKVAKKILSRWNVSIDVAENGIVALKKYKKNKYDVILMDIQMPEMDGYTATKYILAITASASIGNQEKASSNGMNDYVTKPFNPIELNMKLKKYVKTV